MRKRDNIRRTKGRDPNNQVAVPATFLLRKENKSRNSRSIKKLLLDFSAFLFNCDFNLSFCKTTAWEKFLPG